MNKTPLTTTPDSVDIAISCKTLTEDIVDDIYSQLQNEAYAFILVFFSPLYVGTKFSTELRRKFNNTPVYGCSSAGELTSEGLSEGAIVAVGFRASDFGVVCCLIENLNQFTITDGQAQVQKSFEVFQSNRSVYKPHSLALMLVDGLCYCEERLVSAVNSGIKDIPLIGGSAGDGLQFSKTSIVYDGEIKENAAILLLIESRPPLHIFKSDSFLPSPVKFVVTRADPEKRIVYELNAMPAATAYATALGVNETDLNPLSFASHPLSVCFGGDHYVRSIQDVNADGSFRFYCAIDEGIVFTLSEIGDMVQGIEETMEEIQQNIGKPQMVLGFDCILRRLMYEINQSKGQVNQLFKDHRVIGFNTYGEQIHGMHLNQTFSGIAIGR